MELEPRELSFVKAEMEKIEKDESRQPTERTEAGRIKEKAELSLTE